MDLTVGNNYKLTKRLNSGSFGEIYIGLNLLNNKEVAVKLEPIKCKHHPQLQYESKLLAYLLNVSGKVQGFPQLYYFGKDHTYSIMVVELLGPSMEELFQRCGKRFDLKTVVMVGLQIIDRLEHMHRNKFIHRDIKPENFLLGAFNNCDKVYVIDFGLSKKYLQKDSSHVPYKDNKSLVGTPRYASINNHLGIEQSRRDDLESVIYMLIYFMKGSLPWQNLKSDRSYGKYEKILEKKLSVSVKNLVKDLPVEFGELVEYTRSLHFMQDPNYNILRRLLEQAYLNEYGRELRGDEKYCWEELKIEGEQQVKEQVGEHGENGEYGENGDNGDNGENEVMKEAEDFFDFDHNFEKQEKPNAEDDDFNFEQF